MSNSRIQSSIDDIVKHFDRHTTLAEAKQMMRDSKTLVGEHYRQEMGAGDVSELPKMAGKHPEFIHSITTRDFGFKTFEQPRYSEVDDYAWEFSQRYTTLEGVTLPENAVFYTSDRKEVPRGEVERKMAAGGHHLFDIALSNEYVLLDENEKFSVRDIENRFSTNNEHLPPQSQSRRDGSTKVFKSDPRMIVISYMETNGARGHLQVVFQDEHGKPLESIALHRRPGQMHSELTRQSFDSAGNRGQRYPIGPEDAPYYAHALALTHFANGFSEEGKSWFDKAQAKEVVNMLRYLSKQEVDAVKEPVIRDVLGDAKVLKGNINPVALLPDMFASALNAEIGHNKFRESRHLQQLMAKEAGLYDLTDRGDGMGFVEMLQQRAAEAATQQKAAGGRGM